MKKHIGKLLLLLLVTLLAVVLAACNGNTGNPGDDGNGGGGDKPTTATHKVHFDAGGGFDLGTAFDVEVQHGGTVDYPTDKNGEAPVLTRLGYTFTGWVYGSSGTEFVFADRADEDETPTVVTTDITISATWSANTYTHTLVTTANSADHPYGGDAANGGWSYSGNLTFDKAEGAQDPSFVTRYGEKSAVGSVPVLKTDVEGDWFLYWYYVTVETVDGETVVTEVPFTTSRTSSTDSTALTLLAEYTSLTALTLYPKMHSQLPDFTLAFDDGQSVTLKEGDTVDAALVGTPAREGYFFDGWYYSVTTGEGDDAVTVERELVFSGVEDEDADPTELTDLIGKEDENGNFTLAVRAKWVRNVTVTGSEDLIAFRDSLQAALDGEDAAEKTAYLEAHITFALANGSALSLTDVAPLYSVDAPFAGVLDGGGASIVLNFTSAYTGSDLAFIAASKGSVSDLTVTMNVNALKGDDAVIRVGFIAVNGGSVSEVTSSLYAGASSPLSAAGKTVYIGGIAAVSEGGSSVSDCTVKACTVQVSAANAYAGGVTARAGDTSSNISSVKVANFTADISAGSSAYAGGIAARATSLTVSGCGVLSSDMVVSAKDVYAGGIAGMASGGLIEKCHADGILTATTTKTLRAGGIAGYGMSSVSNCRSGLTVNGNAAANGAELYLGGIAGDARRLNIGASSSASSTGDIYTSVAGGSVTAATGEFSATVYIGGIAGRMSYMRSERTAADVAVTVTGSAANVRAGAHTGGILNTVTYSKAYYAKEATVTVNGETATSPSLSGVSETERANFKDTDWLTGNDKLNLDHAVWTATEDGPRLVLETEEN